MWSLLLVGCVGIAVVSAYSGGPPTGACKSMQPGPPHKPNSLTRKEKKNPPFNLVAEVQDNGQVKVFLRSKFEDRKFRGFMIMAEVLGERGHGYFVPTIESKPLAKTLNCEDMPSTCPDPAACQGTANAIAHNSGDDKDSITVIWTPPSRMSGDVTFQATVVGENSDVSTWWENIRSDTVTVR